MTLFRARLLLLLLAACAQPPSGTDQAASAAASTPSSTTSATARMAKAALPTPPVQAGSTAPNLFVAGDALLLTWMETLDGNAHGGGAGKVRRVRFARLRNGAWGSPSTIAQGTDIWANWADVPSVAQAADGTLVAHWAKKSGAGTYAYDVALARSTDGGTTWRRLGTAHDDKTQTEHGFVSLVSEGNAVRAFWLDGRETAHADKPGTMTLRTGLIGATGVSHAELVDPSVCDCCRTGAAVTARGPLVVYRDRTEGDVRDISVIGRLANVWSEPAPVYADGWKVPGCPVNGPAVVADSKRVAVAWYTYAEQRARIHLAVSDDAGRTFGQPILVDATRGRRTPIGRVGVALDDGDGAVVSWVVSDREDATLLVARITSDGRVGDAVTVTRTNAARDSGFPKLVRFAGRLVFVWTEAGDRSHVRLGELRLKDLPRAQKRADDVKTSGPGVLTVGATAPEIHARALDGKKATLSSLRGKAVLVNLWATWCEPCRMELSELKKLHARYASKGLTVLAVSVDRERTPDQIRKFVERRKLPFTIWHDRRDSASAAFHVSTLPATFVIDKRGTVLWSRSGAITARDAKLVDALDRAIAP